MILFTELSQKKGKLLNGFTHRWKLRNKEGLEYTASNEACMISYAKTGWGNSIVVLRKTFMPEVLRFHVHCPVPTETRAMNNLVYDKKI